MLWSAIVKDKSVEKSLLVRSQLQIIPNRKELYRFFPSLTEASTAKVTKQPSSYERICCLQEQVPRSAGHPVKHHFHEVGARSETVFELPVHNTVRQLTMYLALTFSVWLIFQTIIASLGLGLRVYVCVCVCVCVRARVCVCVCVCVNRAPKHPNFEWFVLSLLQNQASSFLLRTIIFESLRGVTSNGCGSGRLERSCKLKEDSVRSVEFMRYEIRNLSTTDPTPPHVVGGTLVYVVPVGRLS